MLTRTIEHYVALLDQSDSTRLPIFKLQLCLDEEDDSIEFFPSVADLQEALCFPINTIAAAMQNVSDIRVSCVGGAWERQGESARDKSDI